MTRKFPRKVSMKMNKLLKVLVVFLALLVVPIATHASPVIDQNNPSVNGGFCYLGVGGQCGQSFQQSSTNISGAGFYVHPNYGAPAGNVTISIYSSYSYVASGLIASGTVGGGRQQLRLG